ncbi:MAG: TolC family protein, partial [Gemmatimonadaceae bacterium]
MPTMRYRLGGVLCAAILAAAPPLGAQHPLTLQEAISLAERQGLQAQAARQTLVAARARNRAFGERLLPQISLGGTVPNYSRAIVPVIQPDGSQLFTPLQQTTSQLGVTVSQQLPFTGGSLTVSSSLQRFEMTGAQQVRTWSSAPMTVSLQQDILRPNTMKWDARVQDLTIEISRRQYAEAREAVAQQTTGAFFDLYSAQMAEANAAHNAAVNDTLYTLNKGRFQVGKIGENDLLQSELALLRARTSLDGAKLDLDRALSAFRLAINVPADTAVTIAVTSDVPKVELDTTLAVTEA